MTTTTHDPQLDPKIAELCWGAKYRNVSPGDARRELVAYADSLGIELDLEEADTLLTTESNEWRLRLPEAADRAIAQTLLNAEADYRSWLAMQIRNAEDRGDVVAAFCYRQARAKAAALGLVSGN